MNHEIEKKRADILQYFDENSKIDETNGLYYSKTGLYHVETERYRQNDPKRNWVITKVSIRHTENRAYHFEYLTDNDDTFFEWLHIDDKEYLLWAEFQGGQSIFDLFAQQLYSHYSEKDPFIWLAIYPSPNQNKLAVLGCYWACPSATVVYNCKNVLDLPYKPILNIDLDFKEWIDDNRLIFINEDKNQQELNLNSAFW